MVRWLKLETAFPRALGKSFDPAVVEVPAPVEDNLGYPGGEGLGGDQRTNLFGLLALAMQVGGVKLLALGGHGGQRAPLLIVNNLHVYVPITLVYTQSRAGSGTENLGTDSLCPFFSWPLPSDLSLP